MSIINELISFFLLSFCICLFLLIFFIPILRKIKFGQSIRLLGPKTHYGKQGTPTMGGIAIVLGVLISFIYISIYKINISNTQFLMLVMPMIMYSSIGLIDDYLIVIRKDNNGLSVKCKLFFQIIWGAIYFVLFLKSGFETKMNLFGKQVDIKWLYGVIILLMFVSTSNAVNITDGLDGLATGVIIPIIIGLIIISYKRNIFVAIFSVILLGGLFAFICYNFYPAKLFMGDVGSLSLGATIANLFIILKIELLLLVFGGVIIIEVLSDIIQVVYFKYSNGKRIFLMAPLHHHFELKGKSEIKIDFIFWLLSIIFVILGLILYKRFF